MTRQLALVVVMFYRVLFLAPILEVVTAARWNSTLEVKPEKYKDIPGCYVTELDTVLPLGKEETSADCVLFRCHEEWVDYHTCDLNTAAPDCKMLSRGDRTKPYPECCPVIKCFELESPA